MINRAVLWVSQPAIMFQSLGGMKVLERQLFTAARAGISEVWIAIHEPDKVKGFASLRIPPDMKLHWIQREQQMPTDCAPPYLGISGHHLIRPETLCHVSSQNHTVPIAYTDAQGASVIQVLPNRTDIVVVHHKQPLAEGCCLVLEPPLHETPLSWLLATGPKPQDGFMARHFDRHISLALSRFLLDTPITPNMMTVLSTLIGLLGTTFFLVPTGANAIVGAVLVWIHSVLDGCDGEIARIKFLESPLGSDLDFWGDNLVHLSLFACLSVGFSRADSNPLILILGLSAGIGIIGSAIIAFRQRVAKRRSAAPSQPASASPLSRVETILVQRDFIYVLLILAYIDRTFEFLWAGAIGAPLFFAVMLYNVPRETGHHEQEPQPQR